MLQSFHAKTRPSHGAKTRGAILRTAADVASVDGLDGLSIGRLATELAMSKSGLFAHFGSKQDLQLATIEEARQRYVREVIGPAHAAGSGITRLHALCEGWVLSEVGVSAREAEVLAALAEHMTNAEIAVLTLTHGMAHLRSRPGPDAGCQR